MASIFTKIINGAFLDINPETKGHTLVVPKAEVDKIYDLEDDDWNALWASVKKVAKHMEEVTGRRVVMKVVGTDVPHAHVHLTPLSETWEYGKTLKLREDEFEEIRAKLAF